MKTNLFNSISKIRYLALLIFLTLVSTHVWGETIELTQSALGLTGSYTTNTTKTVSNVDFTFTDLMKNSDNIQAKASNGVIYNSSLIPGKITSVAITHSGTARSTTIYMGTSSSSITTQAQTGSGSITGSTPNNTCPGYFKITCGSNAAYWTKVVVTYTPATITLSKSSISGLNYAVGSGPSASQTFTVSGSNIPANLIVTAPTNFEVSLDGSSWASSKTINVTLTGSASAGTLSSTTVYVRLASGKSAGNYSGNVSIEMAGCKNITNVNPKTVAVSGTVSAASTPTITASPTTLNWGSVAKGASLTTKTFSISGTNLTSGSLSITASSGWSVSPTSKSVSGTLAATTITVTPPSTATAGTKNGTITISGGGLASSVTVSCSLTVQEVDEFIDALHSTSGYTEASPHTESGSYSTPSLSDKATATSGTCEQQHYHFVGWITSAKYEAGTTIAAGDLKTPTSATGATYYAVWAKGSAGSNTTESVTWSDRYSTNATSVEGTELTIETNAKVTHNKGTNNNACQYYTTGSAIRVYGGGNFVVTAPTAISAITITFGSGDGSNAITADVGTYSSGSWAGSSSSVTFSVGGTSGHRRIAGISVTYGGETTYSDYITTCCTPLGQINGSLKFGQRE